MLNVPVVSCSSLLSQNFALVGQLCCLKANGRPWSARRTPCASRSIVIDVLTRQAFCVWFLSVPVYLSLSLKKKIYIYISHETARHLTVPTGERRTANSSGLNGNGLGLLSAQFGRISREIAETQGRLFLTNGSYEWILVVLASKQRLSSMTVACPSFKKATDMCDGFGTS